MISSADPNKSDNYEEFTDVDNKSIRRESTDADNSKESSEQASIMQTI